MLDVYAHFSKNDIIIIDMKIYDVVADLCSFIIKSCTEDFFVLYSCISVAEKQRIFSIVSEMLPEFFETANYARFSQGFSIHQFSDSEFTPEFYGRLEKLVLTLKNEKDFFAVVGLVQIIDESLETILKNEIRKFQEDDFSVIMNSNREQVGVGLLPRCSCCWERKRRLSHYYNRIDNFLFNLLVLENSILGELIDKHIFLKPDFFKDFESKKALKIAATPLQLEKNFDFNFHVADKVQYFSIDYKGLFSKAEEDALWGKIVVAGESGSDIIVFPEALGKKDMVGAIQKKIRENDGKIPIPSMIVLPSHWENFQNTVTVLDRHGSIVCRQSKQNPFKEVYNGTNWLEHIRANNIINILHFQGVGRIAILICKDFLTTKYTEQLMRCFKLTLLIVPSFSTGSYDFKQSFDLCAHDDCNVVWINSCAAMEEGKEHNFENIGYVRKRISRKEDESQKLFEMKTCSGAFCGKCKKDCIFFETIGAV